jgi:hypothetical protein
MFTSDGVGCVRAGMQITGPSLPPWMVANTLAIVFSGAPVAMACKHFSKVVKPWRGKLVIHVKGPLCALSCPRLYAKDWIWMGDVAVV